MRRTYGQYCTLARALDVVGERWTLLIVRELFVRPKRFRDLLAGLPGISRNLLAARLHQLEGEGLVTRRPAEQRSGAHVYELTEEARALGPALTELARWGARRLGPLRAGDAFQGQWMMRTMAATADRQAARGVHEVYEIDVAGDVFHVRVEDGRVTPAGGHADEADLVIRASPSVVASVGAGAKSVVEAVTDGELDVEGPPGAVERFLAIFGSFWSGGTAAASSPRPSSPVR